MLTAQVPPPSPPPPVRITAKPRSTGFPTTRDDWLRLAERVVGDWAATLRAALVLALLFVAMVVTIGVAFGPASAAATTAVGALVFLAGRHRGSTPD